MAIASSFAAIRLRIVLISVVCVYSHETEKNSSVVGAADQAVEPARGRRWRMLDRLNLPQLKVLVR